MRHKLSGRQLSRNSPHRHAMLRNMAVSLLRHETMRTTLPKAKELRRVVEPLITLAKDDTEAHRRLAFSRLRDPEVVTKLFDDLGARFKARPGGYTRILHMLPRPGMRPDGADAVGRPAERGQIGSEGKAAKAASKSQARAEEQGRSWRMRRGTGKRRTAQDAPAQEKGRSRLRRLSAR